MTPPTERQVLYALAAGGFFLTVAVLVVFAALSGLSPTWWTAVVSILGLTALVYSGLHWRATARILAVSIGLFVVWAVGTLVTR